MNNKLSMDGKWKRMKKKKIVVPEYLKYVDTVLYDKIKVRIKMLLSSEVDPFFVLYV